MIIEADSKHMFCLDMLNKGKKKIALRPLYRLVYGINYCIDSIVNLEGEQWKVINGTDGKYWISSKGRCKSMQGYNAVILKPFENNNKGGYQRIDIIIDGYRQSKLIHRLVADAFLPRPESIEMQLHHKDLNKRNNEAENLEWLTPFEHKKKHIKGDKKK